MPTSDWTLWFNQYLEKLLPVRNVIREPGVALEIGTSRRSWRADFCFSLAGHRWVVEAKLGQSDTLLDGMKILAYQKVFNNQTHDSVGALIVSREHNTKTADLLLCGLVHVSVLAVNFNETKNTLIFRAKLDGSLTYEKEIEKQNLVVSPEGVFLD